MWNIILNYSILIFYSSKLLPVNGFKMLLPVDELRAKVIGLEQSLWAGMSPEWTENVTCQNFFARIIFFYHKLINEKDSLLLGNFNVHDYMDLREIYSKWKKDFESQASTISDRFYEFHNFLKVFNNSRTFYYYLQNVVEYLVPYSEIWNLYQLNITYRGLWGFSQHAIQLELHNILKNVRYC